MIAWYVHLKNENSRREGRKNLKACAQEKGEKKATIFFFLGCLANARALLILLTSVHVESHDVDVGFC